MARWKVRCNCGNPHCPDMIEVTGCPCGCREARPVGLGFSDRLNLQADALWRSCDGDGVPKPSAPPAPRERYVSSYVPPPDRYPVASIPTNCTVCGCQAIVRFDNCGCIETTTLQQGNAGGKCEKHSFKHLRAGCKGSRKTIVTATFWQCAYCEAAAVTRTHANGYVEYWPAYINRTASAKCPKDHFSHLGERYVNLENTFRRKPKGVNFSGWTRKK